MAGSVNLHSNELKATDNLHKFKIVKIKCTLMFCKKATRLVTQTYIMPVSGAFQRLYNKTRKANLKFIVCRKFTDGKHV